MFARRKDSAASHGLDRRHLAVSSRDDCQNRSCTDDAASGLELVLPVIPIARANGKSLVQVVFALLFRKARRRPTDGARPSTIDHR